MCLTLSILLRRFSFTCVLVDVTMVEITQNVKNVTNNLRNSNFPMTAICTSVCFGHMIIAEVT